MLHLAALAILGALLFIQMLALVLANMLRSKPHFGLLWWMIPEATLWYLLFQGADVFNPQEVQQYFLYGAMLVAALWLVRRDKKVYN